ncbi:hypothetical protein NP493_283g06010 [Ridgeia piscesae]|uniref:Uncharacterized protein n=1 Tax=Ridgeia piscesae TaxID=27915 RepID=A0AAD9NX76_RIDPI|nr:hypothetical protein NP493_283g06010 [Ridgeia piscesae]
MGCVALIAIVIVIIVILFWRQQHSQNTGHPVRPSTGVDGTSTQPYVAMNGVNGIQSDKDSYETIQSPTDHYVYKGLDRQTDKVGEDEASSDSVEEDAQPYDDNCKTSPIPQNSTPLSATGTPGKVRPTIININAHNLHMQYGDNNEIGINHSS